MSEHGVHLTKCKERSFYAVQYLYSWLVLYYVLHVKL